MTPWQVTLGLSCGAYKAVCTSILTVLCLPLSQLGGSGQSKLVWSTYSRTQTLALGPIFLGS